MPGGRPSTFDPDIYEAVCVAIEETPRGLKWILDANDEFPNLSTFYLWQDREGDGEELMTRYRRARRRQATLLIDETMEISDDDSQDIKLVGREGEEREVMNSEFAQRSKLRIETRIKLACKLDPTLYGDKITQEHKGGISIISATPEDEQI